MAPKQKLTLADLKQLGDPWNERGSIVRSMKDRQRRDLSPAQLAGQVGFEAKALGITTAMNWWGWIR